MNTSHRIGTWQARAVALIAAGGLVASGVATAGQTAFAATSTYSTAVLSDSPAAYYRLGEASGPTAIDSSIANHSAAISAGVTFETGSALASDTNTAVTLDGSTGNVRGSTALPVGADFTIEAWVKPTSATVDAPVVSFYNASATRTLYFQAGKFLGMASMGSNWPSFTVISPVVSANVWHHVVFTTQGGTSLRLYVDGAQSSAMTVAALPSFSANPNIGYSDASWLHHFGGSVDEVAVYPSALSASRVSAHYSAGSPPPTPTPVPPTATATATAVPPTATATAVPPTPTATATATAAPTCTGSLQSLVNAAAAGSTLNVPACLYRETVNINKALTMVGQPGSEIRGSDVWTAWTASGSIFLSSSAVPALPVVSLDPNACEANTNNQCMWAAQVFVDGSPLTQLVAGSTPAAGQFALVSTSDRHVRLGTNPAGHVVEVTTRARWIVTGANGVSIKSIIMRHAGNSALTGGVSNDGFSNWSLENSTLSYAHAADVSMDGGSNVRLINNDIGFGGLSGVSGNSISSGGVVQGNRIHNNRVIRFGRAWGAGGLKVTQVQNFLIDGNEVDHNDGTGLWCDIGCSAVTFSNNRVHHNFWHGILFEISNGASIHDNAAWENGWGNATWGWGGGIVISSSANAEVYHNTLAWNYAGISVIAQNRPGAPNPVGMYVHDNTVIKKTVFGDFGATYWQNLSLAWLGDTSTFGQLMYAAASNNRGANNRYYYDSAESLSVRFAWTKQYLKMSDFTATTGGTGSSYMTASEMSQALSALNMPAVQGTP